MLRDGRDVSARPVARGVYEGRGEPRSPPTADAIDRMDESLPWLTCLDQHARRLVLLRIRGREWYVLAGYLHRSESTAKRRYYKALEVIRKKLASGGKFFDLHCRSNNVKG